jgi:hypothetical protein
MAPRDPYRMLARQLEASFRTPDRPTQRMPLYLTSEEWGLIIKALHNAAAPYATQKKTTRKPKTDGTAPSNGGTDATG